MTAEKPSYKLKPLTHISIESYVPSWFWIKSHPHCVDGPKNLLKMIEFSRKLKQKIAQKSIQCNGFYAHPEAILRSLLADDDQSLRQQAVEKVLAIRADLAKTTEEDGEEETEEEEEEDEDEWEDEDDLDTEELILDVSEQAAIENSTVRQFGVPKINFKATTYPNLINWKKTTFSEPPITLTLALSDDELRGLVEKPLFVPFYPCHMQAVERAIKLVTEATGSVVGAESRDGYICQKIKSRKVCLKGSKQNFFPKLEKQ